MSDSASYRPTSWLKELVRTPKAAAFPWGLSLRLVVGLAIPFAVGLAIGAPLHILFCVLGVLLATSTQKPVAYRRSILQVALTAPVGVAAYFVGLVASNGLVWQTIVIALVALLCGLVSATGGMASTLAMEAMIVVIIVANIPLASFDLPGAAWLLLPLLFLAGVALALVLLLIEAAVLRSRPERQSFAALVDALAAFATATAADKTMDAAHHASARHTVLQARRTVISADDDAYRELLFDRAHGEGPNSENEHRAALLGAASAVSRSIIAADASPDTLTTAGTWLAATATQLRAHGRPTSPPVPVDVSGAGTGPDDQLRLRVQALASLLWPALYASTAAPPTLIDGAAERWLAQGPTVASLPARIRARATVGAAAWRDAVRIALCLAVAVVAGGLLSADHGFWIPLMVAIIMKPDFGSVFARALQRIGGTVLGGLIGVGFALVLPATGPWMPLVILLLALPMPWAALRAYWLLSVFITPVVILLVEWAIATDSTTLAWYRVLDTLVAAAIVLVVGYLIWPQSFRADVPGDFVKALGRLGGYLSAVFAPTVDGRQMAIQRDGAYRELSDLQIQLQRTLAEPPPASRSAEAWYPAVASASRLADLVTAYGEARHRAALTKSASFPVPSADATQSRVAILGDLERHSAAERSRSAHSHSHKKRVDADPDAVPQPAPDPTGAYTAVDEELEHLVGLVESSAARA